MATHAVLKYSVKKFWDHEFKTLDYIQEPFNDPDSVANWLAQGYADQFIGDLCDMRHRLPTWTKGFLDIYTQLGWKDIGVAFYRMPTGTVLPVHQDLYLRYIKVFGLEGKEQQIRRAIVFLEDWQSGHYIEVNGKPFVNWSAGDTIEWEYNTPHMAANIGLTPRYTLQITGHL